jgi:hypothetical protein
MREPKLAPKLALPILDPDYFIVERNPERLHEFARGLLSQLRHIRAGGKADRYPIAKIEAAAVWLIQSYVNAKVVPAPEVAALIAELIKPELASTLPVQRASEEAYWKAIEFEAATQPADKASVYAITRYVFPDRPKEHERTVSRWRDEQHYRDNVALQRRLRLDTLRAKIVGLIRAPATKIARAVQAVAKSPSPHYRWTCADPGDDAGRQQFANSVRDRALAIGCNRAQVWLSDGIIKVEAWRE